MGASEEFPEEYLRNATKQQISTWSNFGLRFELREQTKCISGVVGKISAANWRSNHQIIKYIHIIHALYPKG
jgi:hypothetical protein